MDIMLSTIIIMIITKKMLTMILITSMKTAVSAVFIYMAGNDPVQDILPLLPVLQSHRYCTSVIYARQLGEVKYYIRSGTT